MSDRTVVARYGFRGTPARAIVWCPIFCFSAFRNSPNPMNPDLVESGCSLAWGRITTRPYEISFPHVFKVYHVVVNATEAHLPPQQRRIHYKPVELMYWRRPNA